MRPGAYTALLSILLLSASATEYHVALTGDDTWEGSAARPLRSISAAAALAQPGDVITVHEGIYRERINPPRGGLSEDQRIIYQAAPGEQVVITGSEPLRGWEKVEHDTWRVSVPNDFFGTFNPYADLIQGDWFSPQGRLHHTGAVYLEGHWLVEAATLEDTLQPVGAASARYTPDQQEYLLNVAWLRPGSAESPVPASAFSAQHGVQTAPSTEGGDCVGWIESGDWMRYDEVDFGEGSDRLEILAASATQGGVIELRLDEPHGKILGRCPVPNTGGWQSWKRFEVSVPPMRGVQTICLTFAATSKASEEVDKVKQLLWYATVDETETTIWAQFENINPNDANVEFNVRRSVFYPEQPRVDYITVRGFTLRNAATPWAPPTAEQVGLIGTHWSKGWVIEDNDIAYSTCVGVTLGKYGDEYDNTSENTAEGYVATIERALATGWRKENIGGHVVRNNRIAHCEQAGIVGSLGATFSRITGNEIHDIHVRRLFSGAEMAGIKLHAAIDTVVSHNHIHHTSRGIWLDWMAQGTRVTGNLLHHNGPSEDLFLEVNHGPYLVDNNILLSNISLFDMSQGGAYAHNLFAGRVIQRPELSRETPYHEPHTTAVAGLLNIAGGDNRFYNNLFVGGDGLAPYGDTARPMHMDGNVFLLGAQPANTETDPLVQPDRDPKLTLTETPEGMLFSMTIDTAWLEAETKTVTTGSLPKTEVASLPYENPDGSPLAITKDYTGATRRSLSPVAGPFATGAPGGMERLVWKKLRLSGDAE